MKFILVFVGFITLAADLVTMLVGILTGSALHTSLGLFLALIVGYSLYDTLKI